ncbi:MAG: helix-turn-helix transcriptional regulator [Patescibacteria group bacterium]|nr:helix-turn-helix transcriptional regulator [Patescibacteria group bacterium]
MRGNFYYKRLGNNILKWRKERNLSQQELASLSDTDRSYLAEVEEGKANPSLKFLNKIAKALRIDLKELVKNL